MINDHIKFGSVLEEYFSGSPEDEVAIVIAPFITPITLRKLIGRKTNAIVVTSWRMDHLISGVSSLEIYELCSEMGWKLFINDRLHAKIYSCNMRNYYAGSANVTEKALYDSNGNIEVLVYQDDVNIADSVEIYRIILSSKLVSEEIYRAYSVAMESLDAEVDGCDVECPIISETLHIQYLPATDDPNLVIEAYVGSNQGIGSAIAHDIALFLDTRDMNHLEILADLKASFSENIFVSKIGSMITHRGMSFGEMSSTIHSLCEDVPAPYRKDVKTVTHNLMQWFCMLYPDKYEIVVPRHSQVLRLK